VQAPPPRCYPSLSAPEIDSELKVFTRKVEDRVTMAMVQEQCSSVWSHRMELSELPGPDLLQGESIEKPKDCTQNTI